MASTSTTMMLGREANSLGTLRIKSKAFRPSSSGGVLLFQANFRATSMKNSQITMNVAGVRHLKLPDRREKEFDLIADTFVLGKVEKDSRIFSENYTVRSYDMGPNHTATIQTLMNLLQETVLGHFRSMGVLKDGLGSTPEMSARNLIWILSNTHVVVDRYPTWNDDIRVDTWFIPSGKNFLGIEWIICDSKTGQTLTRASSKLMMMNKGTRKLSEWPEGVRREFEPQYINRPPLLDKDSSRLPKLDHNKMEYVRNGLTPRWNDLDINQHVNNVKYVGMMLESVPISFLESHELYDITVEYRRECAMDDVLQSLTSFCHETVDQCFHLLRSECGAVVVRGKTKWKPKHAKNLA
ncbi:hypothetical protein NE237_030595 [Protea cynaroides]|uniref:Acyl-[acyl-carrier-protein] hydrolase n=1 Tax=Protea cynaroides TaxID=273540 RepID=A0A9Q0JXE0_9MAGN|nr:hypothetical protein NE237_030595 [Protea cynaroides]